MQINWDEYKLFKREYPNPFGFDNFGLLITFMKAYYNIVNPTDIFEIFLEDELARMMLEKRSIDTAEELENYMLYELSRAEKK